jgi:hypothetical protein
MAGDLSRQNAYAGFETDPGYQFRQQQGEQAISRAASAQGGRHGARTLQALVDYNQNIASNEYQNFANRRAALNAQQMQGASSADSAQLQAALNAQQNQMGLANVGYGAMNQGAMMNADLGSRLAGLSANAYGQMSANDAARGQSLASLYQSGGNNIANLASTGGQQMAGMQTARGQGLASLYQGQAANMAGNLTGVANANTQLTGAMIPQYQAAAHGAGAASPWASIGGAANSTLGNLAFLYGSGAFGGGGAGGGGFTTTGTPGVYSRTQGYGGYSY